MKPKSRIDLAATRREDKDAMHWSQGIIAGDWLDGDADVEGQGGNRNDALGGPDPGVFEFDAVGGHRCAQSSVDAVMVKGQGIMV